MVLDGRVPTVAGVALLGPLEFAHDKFPVAVGGGGIPGLLVDSGQLEAEGGSGVRFVACGDEPVGLSLFAGVEGLLFLGLEILDIVGAPTPTKDPVALFHLDSHGFEPASRTETL